MKKPWILAGGGTLLIGNSKFPCDARYITKNTEFNIKCTSEAYWKLPDRVRNISTLLARKGVKPCKCGCNKEYYER